MRDLDACDRDTGFQHVTHPARSRNPAAAVAGYLRGVDEPEAVLRRLERIEQLDRGGASAAELVEELRALVTEAEAWSRREGGDDAQRAVGALRRALQRDMIGR